MPPFPGFTSSETFTNVPDSLFRLLGEIDDLDELKVTLYVLWRVNHLEGALRCISGEAIAADTGFMAGMSAAELEAGLEKAALRGTLIRVEGAPGGLWVVNSPRGRATAEALKKGHWQAAAHSPSEPPRAVPNVFKLYEENIGAITPLIADALRIAEKEYPPDWVEEAIRIAVERNKRNWKYAEAILKRWKDEGKNEGKTQPGAVQSSEKYRRSDFDDFIEGSA